eukprot:366227-Chlamydomonas_euryale.AAC.8
MAHMGLMLRSVWWKLYVSGSGCTCQGTDVCGGTDVCVWGGPDAVLQLTPRRTGMGETPPGGVAEEEQKLGAEGCCPFLAWNQRRPLFLHGISAVRVSCMESAPSAFLAWNQRRQLSTLTGNVTAVVVT